MPYTRVIAKHIVAAQGDYTLLPDGSIDFIILVDDGDEENLIDEIINSAKNDHLSFA